MTGSTLVRCFGTGQMHIHQLKMSFLDMFLADILWLFNIAMGNGPFIDDLLYLY